MEKYSAYRDPGTGIQPFLTPIPSPNSQSAVLSAVALPLRFLIGIIRLVLILMLAVCHVLIVKGVFTILVITPPIHRAATSVASSVLIRLALFCFGLFWIPVEIVSRKRGRGQKSTDAWNPRAGDLIVSNWSSWIELLWLAYRYDPVFVLPAPEFAVQPVLPNPSSPVSHTPGRRSGRASLADSASSNRASSTQIPIVNFYEVSLLTMLRETGHVPPYSATLGVKSRSLDEIRRTSKRPVVVFPECTSSNGRGLLRFADVFKQSIPVKGWNVFVMYDPPTGLSPSLTHSVPSSSFNPLSHMFTLATSLSAPAISIRLLPQSESPSSPTFLVNEVIGVSSARDELAEACAVLISQLGKFKRMTLGWEDKARFLDFYRGKRNHA